MVCGRCVGGAQKVHGRCAEGDGDKKIRILCSLGFKCQ